MDLSISNIAWSADVDGAVYEAMGQLGYSGLEIAPTRIFPERPYEEMGRAGEWARSLREEYGFSIPSMQSIWYGRAEIIFGTAEERQALLAYTKKAIDFAETVGCGNLVFGCPKNRIIPEGADASFAVGFFRELGSYAAAHGTVIGLEANPVIYGTNYINTTREAFVLIERVDSPGFKLNLDVGTMVYNGEGAEELRGKVSHISHVHISEPGLKPIEKRALHGELREVLERENYRGYISVEMGRQEDVQVIREALSYVNSIYG